MDKTGGGEYVGHGTQRKNISLLQNNAENKENRNSHRTKVIWYTDASRKNNKTGVAAVKFSAENKELEIRQKYVGKQCTVLDGELAAII